jgi:hypothetical protein
MTDTSFFPPAPPRPTRITLDSDTWDEIATAYLDGATAPDLAARYRVSLATVHRHLKKRNASKRGPGATAFARAHAAASLAEDDARRRHRLSNDDLNDLADREPHDPALLAQVATTASGNAMASGRFGEARALADLALHYGRIAEHRPLTFRRMLLDAIFDPGLADVFFGMTINGEQPLKEDYWRLRAARRAEAEKRAAALREAQARVKLLEEKLRALGVEV